MSHTETVSTSPWGELVEQGRKALSISQTGLSKEIGVARETVWRWESGLVKPDSVEMVLKVAKVLHLDQLLALNAAGIPLGALSPHESGDEEAMQVIKASDAPRWLKKTLIEHVKAQKEADEKRRRDYVEGALREAGKLAGGEKN